MTQDIDALLGFAPDYDSAIAYMRQTREYYAAIGYTTPYRWAHYIDAPFTKLTKPLAKSRVAMITTAAPFQPGKGDQGPGAPYNAEAKFYTVYSGDTALDHDLRIAHVGIDRKHTSMTDSNSWFPLPLLRTFAREGRIGRLAARFHGAPTNRSQQHTIDVDCPEIVARCLADGVDAVVLVANCPVCHQTLSLAARALEAAGIATGGGLFHRRPAGIAQPGHLGYLVERLAGGIVDGGAQAGVFAHTLHRQQLAMAARGQQQQIG